MQVNNTPSFSANVTSLSKETRSVIKGLGSDAEQAFDALETHMKSDGTHIKAGITSGINNPRPRYGEFNNTLTLDCTVENPNPQFKPLQGGGYAKAISKGGSVVIGIPRGRLFHFLDDPRTMREIPINSESLIDLYEKLSGKLKPVKQ